MNQETISSILAPGAIAMVFAAVALLLAVDLPAAHGVRVFVVNQFQRLALLVSGAAMLASLYYSEIAHFTPCEFCWYQRIAMYPLAVILLVAVVSRDFIGRRYTFAISVIGLAISVYHYQMQLFPEQTSVCAGGVSCTARFVDEFGFVTIPFMAGCAFLTVVLLHVAEWRSRGHLGWDADAD